VSCQRDLPRTDLRPPQRAAQPSVAHRRQRRAAQWLARAGANVSVELNSVLAGDKVRIAYLLDKKHTPIDAQDCR